MKSTYPDWGGDIAIGHSAVENNCIIPNQLWRLTARPAPALPCILHRLTPVTYFNIDKAASLATSWPEETSAEVTSRVSSRTAVCSAEHGHGCFDIQYIYRVVRSGCGTIYCSWDVNINNAVAASLKYVSKSAAILLSAPVAQ